MSDVSVQLSAVAVDSAGNDPAIEPKAAHTERILRDDIGWLEKRIAELEAAGNGTEHRLALCYEKLLIQRRRQLAAADAFPGCWRDYLC